MTLIFWLVVCIALTVAFCVWQHHAVARQLRLPRRRRACDIGRIADRHPWVIWLVAAALLAAWLAHNSTTSDHTAPLTRGSI